MNDHRRMWLAGCAAIGALTHMVPAAAQVAGVASSEAQAPSTAERSDEDSIVVAAQKRAQQQDFSAQAEGPVAVYLDDGYMALSPCGCTQVGYGRPRWLGASITRNF